MSIAPVNPKAVSTALTEMLNDEVQSLKTISFASQLATMERNEVISRAFGVDVRVSMLKAREAMDAWRTAMKNALVKQLNRASAKTNNGYTYEFGITLTSSSNLYIVCIITRTK